MGLMFRKCFKLANIHTSESESQIELCIVLLLDKPEDPFTCTLCENL
jgi:hypothetical protein